MTIRDRFELELSRILAEDAERPAIRAKGIDALLRLVPVAMGDSGQSRIVGRFLLGLYNGSAFPFALTDLRGLDTALWHDCLAVLHLDRRPEQEVHQYVENGDEIWSQLKRAWA